MTAFPEPQKALRIQAIILERDANDIVTLRVDCPGSSANVFTKGVMAELALDIEFVRAVHKEKPIRGLIIESAKDGIFIAGADIKEIERMKDPATAAELSRSGQAIFRRLETLSFPTVAAIHGAALGGGLEVALACRYRVASDDPRTKLGLPETQLGVLPAWGGCTRLPRIVGAKRAYQMILSGRELSAQDARRARLVDSVVPKETLHDAAVRMILAPQHRRNSFWAWLRRASASLMNRFIAGPLGASQAMRDAIRETGGHYPALPAAIGAIRAGLLLQAAGFYLERKYFGKLAAGAVCKNLIRLFWIRESNRKNPGAAAKPLAVHHAGVIGAGIMGRSIAYLFAHAGIPVRLSDAYPAALTGALVMARDSFADQQQKRRISELQAHERFALISPTTELSGFDRADIIVEAITENLGVKQETFRALASHARSGCILASNTSSLSISALAEGLPDPERVCGMHFFNPAERMKLVEVVVGERTSAETVATAVALAKRLGKSPIVTKESPGFLVNRVLFPYLRAAFSLFVDKKIAIQDIDKALRGWGMPMGPFELLDTIGFDIALSVRDVLESAYPHWPKMPAVMNDIVAAGFLGAKNGKGFWVKEKKGRTSRRAVNAEILALIDSKTREPRIYASLPASVVVERTLGAMAKEAQVCLDEGVVGSQEDVDLALVLGIGFPPYRPSIFQLFKNA